MFIAGFTPIKGIEIGADFYSFVRNLGKENYLDAGFDVASIVGLDFLGFFKHSDEAAQIAKYGDELAEGTVRYVDDVATSGKKVAKGASKTTLDLMKDVDVINGNYYASKRVIDEIGKAEAKGVDFSSFKKTIQSTRPSTEGGVSQVIRYSDKNGTSFIIHQVTNSTGKILHRDYDAVRIGSGQLINKK